MKIIKIIVILAFLTLSACAAGNIITTIQMPNTKEIYTVSSKSDAHVTFKDGKVDFSVDNRGKLGIIEQILGAIFVSASDGKKN